MLALHENLADGMFQQRRNDVVHGACPLVSRWLCTDLVLQTLRYVPVLEHDRTRYVDGSICYVPGMSVVERRRVLV